MTGQSSWHNLIDLKQFHLQQKRFLTKFACFHFIHPFYLTSNVENISVIFFICIRSTYFFVMIYFQEKDAAPYNSDPMVEIRLRHFSMSFSFNACQWK